MMDYEKKYNEALERAKQIRNGNPSSGTAIVVCEQIFPELKESEDERIRKEMIRFLQKIKNCILENYTTIPISEFISYLEKQKEHVPENEGSGTRKEQNVVEVSGEYKKGFECGKQRVLKYPEEFNLQHVEQKPAWSEEDEKKIHFLIRLIELYIKDDNYCFVENNRMLSKQEIIEMLKSLRPSWRPSEEQMAVLLNAEGLMRANDYKENAKILAEVIEELKKL